MRREILMPPVTPSMTDGKISRWHVAEGQAVAAGDLLVEIATSSATVEIEAEDEGRVERILFPAGTEGVKVNTPIAILLNAARDAQRSSLGQPLSFAALEPLPEPSRTAARPAAAHLEGNDLSYREALRDALADEMRRDKDVFLIGVDVAQNRGAPKVAQGLLDAFGPSRVVSVSSIEEAVLGIAVGAAYAGLKPVVELPSWGASFEAWAPYVASAAETFYLSGGRLPVPIVLRGPNGFAPGLTGQDARCVAAQLAQIPGLKVAQPATASAAYGLLAAAIRDPGPVAVLEHDQLYAVRGPAEPEEVVALGVARVRRAGTDVTLAAAGRAVLLALEAASLLSAEGVEAEVVDLMSVRPLDRDAVAASVLRTGRLVTLEDGWGDGGIGAELVASIVERCFGALKRAPVRLAGAGVPMPYASELQALALPTAKQAFQAILATVRGA
ncbi:pyruvate dehydrogenase complex E1 component subunit beta [Hyphomicrobium sp. LHD-15]|uniref:pyruvate dehydrogenase complex E1 component subunit beta n=1 Tax=Hyphomicrobium sp. LHD-15 TaxID=3072142 RepID=UPI00280F5331|nr:pyruvate dehydrogenase complex E1 component subunit beta [Hyphomicrobium sp. LHD-15]MDQ8700418.1 pyruvate dehydrogenase complex E1 component subunit beta [Hyphomicrobium sp. LHD-15]